MTMIRTTLMIAAAFAGLLAASSVGFAQQGTPEQRTACRGDAFRFCAAEIPNVPKITSCMRRNYERLSPACQAVFVKG
jgi:hypothetical protein